MSQRILSNQFIIDLKSGPLNSILVRAKVDRTLLFLIREETVNLYFRGSSLAKISAGKNGYQVIVDPGYFKYGEEAPLKFPFPIQNIEDAQVFVRSIPNIKNAIDLFLSEHPKDEREFQQLVIRDNNENSSANATDYLICDMEYTHSQYTSMRFDMIAAHWPSQPAKRKKLDNLELAIIEMKFGDKALQGDGKTTDGAGILKHWEDLLESRNHLAFLRLEMEQSTRQLAELGLLTISEMDREDRTEKIAFADSGVIDWILLLANHDPESEILLRELERLALKIRETPDAPYRVKIAVATFMGYGLFDQGLIPLEDFLVRFRDQVYSK